jgi:Calcineurin-like phosphoesterase
LSLWQSAVAEVARKNVAAETGAQPHPMALLEHPAVKATDDFIRAVRDRREVPGGPELAAAEADPHARNVYLSGLTYGIARARVEGRGADEQALLALYVPFSDDDPHFLECPAIYASYYAAHNGVFLYNDWTVQGGGSLQYGVIQWQIPNDAKVGIIGDWGTGMADAEALLVDLLSIHQPAALIHLGDIYYSGTPTECQTNFLEPIQSAFQTVGVQIPVFTLPGNHDYYALGYGFYPMLQQLPQLYPGIVGAEQVASYFCLRTQDGGWQFLGMDTGYEDSNPLNQIDPAYAGPWVQPNEVVWHRDKLLNFSGATILLSHHQLFTANANINGVVSSESEFPYLNPFLLDSFQPFFRDNVAAWLWGHEHNFVLFQNGLFGLAMGRLLGASAFEELVSESPYTVKHPNVPYLDPTQYQLKPETSGIYPHSYSVIDFSVRNSPTDPVAVTHYSFPSWYEGTPPTLQSTVIHPENFSLLSPPPRVPVTYGASVQLSCGGGLLYVAALDSGLEYYPTVGSTPVTLELLGPSGQSGQLIHGSQVLIQTQEGAAGSYNLLGAWATRCLYYYSSGYSQEQWTVYKLDPSQDENICYGDAVFFVNNVYGGQWICPTNDGYLTTTSSGVPAIFTIQQS